MREPITAEDLRSGSVQDQLDLAVTLYLDAVFRYGMEEVRVMVRGPAGYNPVGRGDLKNLQGRIREILTAAEIAEIPVEEPDWDEAMDLVMDRLAKVRGEALPLEYKATAPPSGASVGEMIRTVFGGGKDE